MDDRSPHGDVGTGSGRWKAQHRIVLEAGASWPGRRVSWEVRREDEMRQAELHSEYSGQLWQEPASRSEELSHSV